MQQLGPFPATVHPSRWTWTNWTQDNTSAAYITNPRVTEARVGDGTNTKRTTIDYYEPTSGSFPYGLPTTVQVFNGASSMPMKKTVTTYDLSTGYTSRRIIGLPAQVEAWGWNDATSSLEYVSKVTYGYDEGNFGDSTLQQTISPVQHDSTNYSSSFITGRGNLTSTTRCDASTSSPSTCNGGITSYLKYNTAGSVVARTTPWDGTKTRTTKIFYADVWNDNVTRTTYAYPTTITDPAGNSSTIKYRYDIGANVEATSPAPANQQYGKTTRRVFDSVGRLERDSVYVNTVEQAYTRYEFPTNGTHSKTYSTLVDVDSSGGPDSADEVLTEQFFDGAGRVIKSRAPHTFNGDGTTATWAGVLTTYDILGRVVSQSVPTEVNSGWAATGDDATRGFVYNLTYYDWKNRVVRTRPSDSTSETDGKDTLISYEGCGCAGQITTIKGPVTTAVAADGTTTYTDKRRVQKAYEDILARTYKAEVWDLDGLGSAPYSTTKTWFNGRDQATLIRQYAGADTSSTYQDTTMSYDGHGRVYQSHKPEQRDTSDNLKYTTYSYNLDDSISSITDGRGAVTSYTYNSRALVTNIGWTVPTGSGIVDPADVTFSYDNLGNRTQMTDGLGTQTYAYDSLSRMTSETRAFTGFNSYTIDYTYTLAGQVKSYGFPNESSRTVNYAHDKTGRITDITGGGFAGVYNYLTSIDYRAFGGVKDGSYGSGKTLTQTYDNRLNLSNYAISGSTANTSYGYDNDGSVKTVTDNLDARFDRLYRSDFAGRLKLNYTGLEARDETQTTNDRPFRQTYTFNAFSNLTDRTMKNWALSAESVGDIFANNRKQPYSSHSWTYDNDGREVYFNRTLKERVATEYDAAGNRIGVTEEDYDEEFSLWNSRWVISQSYDGDGQRLVQQENGASFPTLLVRSSVIGGAVVGEVNKINDTWYKDVFVLAGGEIVAQQKDNPSTDEVKWLYTNPITGATRGAVETEPDPLGTDQGLTQRQPNPPIYSGDSGIMDPGRYADAFNGRWCSIDGAILPCEQAHSLLAGGLAAQCPDNNCGPRYNPRDLDGDGRPDTFWDSYQLYADDRQGWGPTVGAFYAGNGRYSLLNRGTPPVLRRAPPRTTPNTPARTGRGGPNGDPEADDALIVDDWDLNKAYYDAFPCNKTVRDIFDRMRTNFRDFANFSGDFGPGNLVTAHVSFAKALIRDGAVIAISNANVPKVPEGHKYVFGYNVTVTVEAVSKYTANAMGFTFVANADHVLYPAKISFTATNIGDGKIGFTVHVRANFNGEVNRGLFEAAGYDLENKIWSNLIRNVSKYCGN